MPKIIEEMIDASGAPLNARQRSDKLDRYGNAASAFVELIEDKGITEITERDATVYRNHWQARVDAKEITADHAVKRLRYMRQLVDYYFTRFSIPPSQRANPYKDQRINKPAYTDPVERRKLAFPFAWVKHRIIEGVGLDGLNDEARGHHHCGGGVREPIDRDLRPRARR